MLVSNAKQAFDALELPPDAKSAAANRIRSRSRSRRLKVLARLTNGFWAVASAVAGNS